MSDGCEDEPHSEQGYVETPYNENLEDNSADKDSNKPYKLLKLEENVVLAS